MYVITCLLDLFYCCCLEKGATDDVMVGWCYRLNGHEFEPTPGDSEGQGSLVCCSPWDHRESDKTD